MPARHAARQVAGRARAVKDVATLARAALVLFFVMSVPAPGCGLRKGWHWRGRRGGWRALVEVSRVAHLMLLRMSVCGRLLLHESSVVVAV